MTFLGFFMLLLSECAIMKNMATIYIYINYKYTNTLQFVVLFTPGPRDIAPAGTSTAPH